MRIIYCSYRELMKEDWTSNAYTFWFCFLGKESKLYGCETHREAVIEDFGEEH
jgi:hypothetical protein